MCVKHTTDIHTGLRERGSLGSLNIPLLAAGIHPSSFPELGGDGRETEGTTEEMGERQRVLQRRWERERERERTTDRALQQEP